MKSGRINLIYAAVLLLLIAAAPRRAAAVIVTLKGETEPIKGYLVRQDDALVVVRETSPDGTLKTRELKRSEIDQVIENVVEVRLLALRADLPQDYVDYARELSKKKDDPEARDTALRLFVTAAFLDPEAHGLESLREMAPLARSEAERRKFRAMAYLLDPAHDQSLIEREAPPAAPPPDSDAGSAALLKAVRMLRQGKKREALTLARRPVVMEQFAHWRSVLSEAEFGAAARSVCAVCEKGVLACPQCDGEGRRRIGATNRRCPTCNGTGGETCVVCQGDHQASPLPLELLGKVLRLELLLSEQMKVDDGADDGPAGTWVAAVTGGGAPAPALSLETITEFDPKKNRYLRGRWVEP